MKYTAFVLLFTALFLISCKTAPESGTLGELPPDTSLASEQVPEKETITPGGENLHYCIIAFDGGGMKGVLAAKLLLMLEEAIPRLLYNINLYTGTSSGGVIGLALSYGKTPAEILHFYLKNGEDIYSPYPVPPGFDAGINRPFYTQKTFKGLLEKEFPRNPALSSLQTDVVVTSFILDEYGGWHPVYFHNFLGSPYGKERVVDIALRTCADPVYFPAYQGYIGGGVFAVNPSLAALSAALDPNLGNSVLKNIRLLSLGTGTGPMAGLENEEDWGAAQWINPYGNPRLPLLKVLMNTSEADDYHCRMVLGDHYRRFNVALETQYAIDDWKNASLLVEKAEGYVSSHQEEWQDLVAWIEEVFLN